MAQELSPERLRKLIPAQALLRVPGAVRAESTCIALLEGGTFNRSFRIDTDVGRFVGSPGTELEFAL